VYAVISSFTELEMAFATTAELPDIYRAVLADGELDAEERVRFVAYLRACFAWLENADWRSQTVMRTAWVEHDTIAIFLACDYIRLLKTSEGDRWGREDAPSLFVPEFQERVNGAIRRAKQVDCRKGIGALASQPDNR
jgi:hypothetical protein